MAMLNKHRKWFHSSRVIFPFAFISASCFLVSFYLIWIMGSPLILSNCQSRATLWVLDTCLIVGLLPLTIVLITASLSSNTYNKASWWEDLMFERRKINIVQIIITLWDCFRFSIVRSSERLHACSLTSLLVLNDSGSCSQELQRSYPIHQLRGYRPTSILHPKKWFPILLNCAKLKFISYKSNLSEQIYDFQKRKIFHPMYKLNRQDLLQNRSLETVTSLHCLAGFPT